MNVGILTLQICLPGCGSLKEKRRRLKPLITRLHKEFNISVAEIDHLDVWQTSMIACAVVSNDNAHTQRSLQHVVRWIELNWPDINLTSDHIEII